MVKNCALRVGETDMVWQAAPNVNQGVQPGTWMTDTCHLKTGMMGVAKWNHLITTPRG